MYYVYIYSFLIRVLIPSVILLCIAASTIRVVSEEISHSSMSTVTAHTKHTYAHIILNFPYIMFMYDSRIYLKHQLFCGSDNRNPNDRLVRHNTWVCAHTIIKRNNLALFPQQGGKWGVKYSRDDKDTTRRLLPPYNIFEIFRKLKVLGAQEIYLIPQITLSLCTKINFLIYLKISNVNAGPQSKKPTTIIILTKFFN